MLVSILNEYDLLAVVLELRVDNSLLNTDKNGYLEPKEDNVPVFVRCNVKNVVFIRA